MLMEQATDSLAQLFFSNLVRLQTVHPSQQITKSLILCNQTNAPFGKDSSQGVSPSLFHTLNIDVELQISILLVAAVIRQMYCRTVK